MSWWTSLKERAKSAKNGLTHGWEKHLVTRAGVALFQFAANTTFHILEQGLALRKAAPTLLYNEKAQKVAKGMLYVLGRGVLPLVTINALYQHMQSHFRGGYDEQQASVPQAVFISALTLGDYLLTAYLWQQGAETYVRTLVLGVAAVPAFNSNKTEDPPSECKKCTMQRKLKGLSRELAILSMNRALIWGVSFIPYIGSSTAFFLTIFNNGRYITRAVTPERCERHKYIEQEFALALGLTFEFSNWYMDSQCNSLLGPLPLLYGEIMHQMMLAFHVNIAAHMAVPLVKDSNKATIPFDFFNGYERGCRFFFDVFWAGLLKRIPIDFKPEPGQPPFLPLSTVLQIGVRVFNSDLERVAHLNPNPWLECVKYWGLPTMFRSTYNFPRDVIIADYWPDIRDGVVNTLKGVESYGQSTSVAVIAWSPRSAAKILKWKWGIPTNATKLVLKLSKESDFWDLTNAVRDWFARRTLLLEEPLTNSVVLMAPLHTAHSLSPSSNTQWPQAASVATAQRVPGQANVLAALRPSLRTAAEVNALRPQQHAPATSSAGGLFARHLHQRKKILGDAPASQAISPSI